VQGTLEDALSTRLRTKTRVVGASRTDTGVHALGQVAHFDMVEEERVMEDVASGKMRFVLNRMLPDDVRVAELGTAEAPPNKKSGLPFHAIFDSRGKIYTYRFQLGTFVSPLERRTRTLVHQQCDVSRLEDAVRAFIGTHDFSSFANNASRGPAAARPTRTIHAAELIDEGRGAFRASFHLDGALHRMVRNMMGMVFAVGEGKRHVADICELFAVKDRSRAPRAAPACGLCLEKVFYDEDLERQRAA